MIKPLSLKITYFIVIFIVIRFKCLSLIIFKLSANIYIEKKHL